MKLYATTTSERATKGQGGNEFIEVHFKDEKQNNLYCVLFTQDKFEVTRDNMQTLFIETIKGNK